MPLSESAAKSKPRILLVNWRDIRNPEAGGAEVHLHEVAKRLVRDGYPVLQYSHAFKGGLEEDVIDGVTVKRIGHRLTFNWTVWRRLASWCREFRADVVLDDSNKVAFFARQFCGKPVVLQLHHLFGRVLFHETSWPNAVYVLAFEKLMPRAYRGVQTLTGSESSRRELLQKGFAPVDLAPEGVNLSDYKVGLPMRDREPLVVYVGRIKRYKGLDVLLRAVAVLVPEIPGLRFHVAGSGDDRPRLEALARDLGLQEVVRFLGFVSEEQKVELYGKAKVVVNSSLKEGWGLTSIEANACGTPVVATDVPGLCDSVRSGETGFLVPFGDVDGFVKSMRVVLTDASKAEAMSTHALAWAARHTWEPAYTATRDALLRAVELSHA
jgi:glycosyltransferase involved in cell wall biosynthesis